MSWLRATLARLLRSLSWRTRSLVARSTDTVPSWSTVLPTTMPRARARNTATSDTMWYRRLITSGAPPRGNGPFPRLSDEQ
jgi:hypothetical protein